MPVLILDKNAIDLAAARLSGQPVFAPNGSLFDPGLIELVGGATEDNPWSPSNEPSSGLVLGAEACREIAFITRSFRLHSERTIKSLSVPVCSLMDVLKTMLAAFNKERWRDMRSSWPECDQQVYRASAKRINRTHMAGPVRDARNHVGAHLDFDYAQVGVRLSAHQLLDAMRDAVLLLVHILNYENAFEWIRPVAVLSNGTRLVDTMGGLPLCMRWLTDNEGKVLDVGCLRLAADPRHELKKRILEAAAAYNFLASETRSSLKPLQFSTRTSG